MNIEKFEVTIASEDTVKLQEIIDAISSSIKNTCVDADRIKQSVKHTLHKEIDLTHEYELTDENFEQDTVIEIITKVRGEETSKNTVKYRPVQCIESEEVFKDCYEAVKSLSPSLPDEYVASYASRMFRSAIKGNGRYKGLHWRLVHSINLSDKFSDGAVASTIKSDVRARKVECIEDKKIFKSMTEASTYYNIPLASVNSSCRLYEFRHTEGYVCGPLVKTREGKVVRHFRKVE